MDMEVTITGLEQHLNDPEYANWIRNTLALNITLGVLKPYVNQQLLVVQRSITDKGPPGVACSSCNVSEAPDCQKNVCNIYRQEIIDNHRQENPSFKNTNASKWSTDTWEIAKCFMPQMPGYRNCTESNADFSAVINIFINCKHFDSLVSCDLDDSENVFFKARTMRNKLMHSGSLKVPTLDLVKNIDLLISLLSCFNESQLHSSEALNQIEKLKKSKLQITLEDVLYAREQKLFAFMEDIENGREEIKVFVEGCIKVLRQEIETATPFWTAPQHRLISNFIKGCKHSLIRLVETESESVKPERYAQGDWNFEEFLNKIELFPELKYLLDRHKRLLYPGDGNPSDINKWDLFLLCHILSLETSIERPNNLINYIKELKDMRDIILSNPAEIRAEDLEVLSGFLDEPLRTEVKTIFAAEDLTEDALQLQTELKSWQQNEDNMESKEIGIKALEGGKILAERLEEAEKKADENRNKIIKLSEKLEEKDAENQKQTDELRQRVRQLQAIETRATIRVRNVDPEQEEQIQSNITSDDSVENISISGGGLNQFQEQMNFENVKTNKGSIILEVTCKSIKELIRFWDSCKDGSAVRALSKVRDDYRKFLGCRTLEFDVVLTKKEVHRCMNNLVDRVSSQILDEAILKEIQAKVERLHTVPAKSESISKETAELGLTEDVEAAAEAAIFIERGTPILEDDKPETIPRLDEHLKNPEYANWIKSMEALRITLGVLKPYVHQQLPAIQRAITDKGPPGVACSSCNVSEAQNCPDNVCNFYKEEIINYHRLHTPSFCNTNACKWSTDAWEIAKCFIPPGGKYMYCTQSEADFSCIINIIIQCNHFDSLVSNQDGNIFRKARDLRNTLTHSDSLTVSEANLQENLNLLISLLSCFNDRCLTTPEALKQIKMLKTGKLQVTLDNILDAREQAFFALREEFDEGKQKIEDFVKTSIQQLRQEIKASSSVWKAPQHRLIGNFIKGCKYSLIRLVETESKSVRPERYQKQKWDFEEFLNKIELFPEVEYLLPRHKRLLYPEDGSKSDINKWDIFLLCHILSLETRVELPNHLVNYLQEIQAKRDDILDNPNNIREEDLETLSGFLDEPIRSDLKRIHDCKDITDDAQQLLSLLKSWQENEDNMNCKKVHMSELEKAKTFEERTVNEFNEVKRQVGVLHTQLDGVQTRLGEVVNELKKSQIKGDEMEAKQAETQKQVDELREDVNRLRKSGRSPETDKRNCETYVRVNPKNCDPEVQQQIQKNITSKDRNKNIAIANGGMSRFKDDMDIDSAETTEGSIILKVTCKSVKDLLRFWDSCMNGTAVRAFSKIRDDYREFVGCSTLTFDFVLTKKEVHRCINHLVDWMSSQCFDENILKEIEAKMTNLEAVSVETMDLAREMMQMENEESVQATLEDSFKEIGMRDLDEDLQGIDVYEETAKRVIENNKQEPGSFFSIAKEAAEIPETGTQSQHEDTSIHPEFRTTLRLKEDAKHGEEEATRLTKFLRQMAESFEEGNISVVKPYLHDMIKQSKNKDIEAFIKTVLDFTEATSFKGGISVSLIKQAQRGFHKILEEPHFGDLVVAKVEAIEKEDQSFVEEASGFDKSPWPMDVKSTVIIAEDIQVGGTKTSNTQSSPFTYQKSRLGTGSSKEKESGYSEDPIGKVTDFGSKLSETTTISSDTEAYRTKSKGFEQPLSPLQQESPKTGPSGSIDTTPKPP